MKNKRKNIITTAVFLGFLLSVSVISLIKKDQAVSVSERRPLTQWASYTKLKGEANNPDYGLSEYFQYLEQYLLDQFPNRDAFRSIKALTSRYLYRQKDVGGYYYVDGTLSKMETSLSEKAVKDAIRRFNDILESCFPNEAVKTYFSLVPDKNYLISEKNAYLHPDYERMLALLKEGLSERFQWISLMDSLSITDYYVTDPHWAQERILPVADVLLQAMGAEKKASDYQYGEVKLSGFGGTYYGQAALPVKKDTLTYLTNALLSDVTVTDLEKNETLRLYNEDYFTNVDPYDVFLGGAKALLTISNPNANNKKQLVVFRDSFASALVPLLVSEYEEIIVVDIRYVSPAALPKLVAFRRDCDVLFLYSTSVLNSYGVFR